MLCYTRNDSACTTIVIPTTMKSLHALFKARSTPAKTTSISKTSPSPSKRFSPGPTSVESYFVFLIHSSESTRQLRRAHALVLRRDLFWSSRIVTQLISAASVLKSAEYALSIFRFLEDKNIFVFNALIRGLTDNSRFESSLSHFVDMMRLGVRPDWLTYAFSLKSTATLGFEGFGMGLHCGILKSGIEFDTFVRVSLVDLYVKIARFGFALQAFDEIPEQLKNRSVLLWNVMINGCCILGDLRRATELFESMPERNAGSWSTLINGFVKDGYLDRAKELFDQMPEKGVVAWTTMVNAFSKKGEHESAISMFFKWLHEGLRPNDYTLSSVLSSCAKVGALETGKQIHDYILDSGFKLNGAVGTALVDMYAKSGDINAARTVFNAIKYKDFRIWSVMIRGWAAHGCMEQASQCCKEMINSGEEPDEVAFLALLTACLNSGQVDLGLNIFESMKLDYYIEPNMKHYASVVELLGSAGRLKEAQEFTEKMPVDPDFVVWGLLYRACRAHRNIDLSQYALKRLLKHEPEHLVSYIFLSNVYAAEERWTDVEKVRMLIDNMDVKKDPRWSYIEVDGRVYKFVRDSCEKAEEMYMKLEEIMSMARKEGYKSEPGCSIHHIEEEESEDVGGIHSEKLALAFGLLVTDIGKTLRIAKNLRICRDCHSLMKIVCKMSQRGIIVRDGKRFHHFKHGVCSCRDCW